MAGKPNELQITRILHAPVKVVWEAWTDPAQVAKWWGPRGFTLTTHSKDLRTGGHWHYTMHGPDGTDYPNKTTYLEVEKYAKLVYDHGANDDRPPMFRVTVRFSESGGKTTMDMTMTLPTAEAAQETRKFIRKAGGDSTWDRLAEYLEKGASGKETFIINRSFPVSLETMFDMWTQPRHLAKWLPPKGFTMAFPSADIRPGSTSAFSMSSETGSTTLYGRVHYLAIEKPHRIVYTQQFTDEHGNISRHPGAPVWPETMLTTVTLTPEGPQQTRITVEWQPYGKATPEEIAAFAKERPGMTAGWTGSFDKLEELLVAP